MAILVEKLHSGPALSTVSHLWFVTCGQLPSENIKWEVLKLNKLSIEHHSKCVMKPCAVSLHPTQDVNYPFVQCIHGVYIVQ